LKWLESVTSANDLPPTPPAIYPFDDNAFPISCHKVGYGHYGPFPKGNETTKIPISVAVDYFTKWVDVEVVASSKREVHKFI